MTEGTHDSNTIATHLQTALNNGTNMAANSYAVTFDAVTGKLSVAKRAMRRTRFTSGRPRRRRMVSGTRLILGPFHLTLHMTMRMMCWAFTTPFHSRGRKDRQRKRRATSTSYRITPCTFILPWAVRTTPLVPWAARPSSEPYA